MGLAKRESLGAWRAHSAGRTHDALFAARPALDPRLAQINAPEYQEISLSTWPSNNTAELIADNFGLSAEDINRLPKTRMAIAAEREQAAVSGGARRAVARLRGEDFRSSCRDSCNPHQNRADKMAGRCLRKTISAQQSAQNRRATQPFTKHNLRAMSNGGIAKAMGAERDAEGTLTRRKLLAMAPVLGAAPAIAGLGAKAQALEDKARTAGREDEIQPGAALQPGGAQQNEAAYQPKGLFDPLENFKYDLERSPGGKVAPGGTAKEVTVAEFPVSQSIAGVSMRLKPGGLRELHWHATAAEWAYVISGRVRTTVIAPTGEAAQDDFGPGDIWYFPRGHAHSLQGLGPGETHFVLVFDDGRFSEFGTFSITDWLAQTPPEVVARNTGLSAATIAGLPKRELYIPQGKVPPAAPAEFRNGNPVPSQRAHKFKLGEARVERWPGGEERIVDSHLFPISTTIVGVVLELAPGGLREMHWHPNADEWQYYISGRARVGIFGAHGRSKVEEFAPGQVAFVRQGFGHYIQQVGTEPVRVLITFNAPEYQEISLSTWLSNNTPELIADNFGLSGEDINRLPKTRMAIAGPSENKR